MNITVYGSASRLIDNVYKESGIRLGEAMASRNIGLVFGAGRNGMMGAVAQGEYENGGYILGISTKYLYSKDYYNHCTEFIVTDTMRERKKLLYEKGDAFIITPGGIGTFDEFFEIFTLKQLGRHNKAICIYNINTYYDDIISMFQKTINKRFVTSYCFDLLEIFYDPNKMLDYIESYIPEKIDLSKLKIR